MCFKNSKIILQNINNEKFLCGLWVIFVLLYLCAFFKYSIKRIYSFYNQKNRKVLKEDMNPTKNSAKAFDCVDHNKLWKILKEMGMPDHLTCLLRNLYAGQEATVRSRHGTTHWFQIGKGVRHGCKLSPHLSNLHAEAHHAKCWAGGSKSWNQDCWEKYQ